MNWLEKLIGDTQVSILRMLRRSQQTITSLAKALGLTDNAVRTHIAALGRDGLIEQVGSQRETGGKPARLYDLTRDGEELFPKAYAAVLSGLIERVAERDGWEKALELLREVGVGVAAGSPASKDPELRVRHAATVLRSLGGEIDVVQTPAGWRLQGFGCPLSQVTEKHPQVCALAHALVAEVTHQPVIERCNHEGRPRCGFDIQRASAAL